MITVDVTPILARSFIPLPTPSLVSYFPAPLTVGGFQDYLVLHHRPLASGSSNTGEFYMCAVSLAYTLYSMPDFFINILFGFLHRLFDCAGCCEWSGTYLFTCMCQALWVSYLRVIPCMSNKIVVYLTSLLKGLDISLGCFLYLLCYMLCLLP